MMGFRLALLATIGGMTGWATAQSINVDLDILSGGPDIGAGAPDSLYGGAAGQAGFWNLVNAGGPRTPITLNGLDGNATSAQLVATGGEGSAGGFNFHGNTGGFQLLMDDYAFLLGPNHEIDYHFSGFLPGQYLLYTYAISPGVSNPVDVLVTVPGAIVPQQHVTGPMSANLFQIGVTHTIHELTLTGTSFEIDVHTVDNSNLGQCNGFQIVAVPEPTTLFIFGPAILAIVLRRRRRL